VQPDCVWTNCTIIIRSILIVYDRVRATGAAMAIIRSLESAMPLASGLRHFTRAVHGMAANGDRRESRPMRDQQLQTASKNGSLS